MTEAELARGLKAVLRYNIETAQWDWRIITPLFRVVTLSTGKWRVNRVMADAG